MCGRVDFGLSMSFCLLSSGSDLMWPESALMVDGKVTVGEALGTGFTTPDAPFFLSHYLLSCWEGLAVSHVTLKGYL